MASESNNGGHHDEGKMATIRIFYSHETAELAAANLRAHDIECWVKADDCGGMYPNLTAASGARLLVNASDAEAAIALLDTPATPSEISQIEAEAVASAPPEAIALKKPALGQILLGVISGIILCLTFQWADNLGTKTCYHYTADGKRNEAWIYQDGHLIEFLQDRNLDGAWDHWTYYENGRIVRSEYDNNFDGKPDETWTYSNGVPVALEKDTDFNGIPDLICTYKYGILQNVDIKPNGSKFAVTREIFQNGVLTEIWRGGDSNGNFSDITGCDPFFNTTSRNANQSSFQLLSSPSK